MKAKYLYFSLLLSLYFSIFSCKKDSSNANSNNKFPRKLYLTQITQKDIVRVYTANGEITDASQKDKFLGPAKEYFNLVYQQGDTSAMTFINRDTALLISPTEKFVVTNNNGQFIFTDAEYRVPVDKTDILYEFLKYDYPLIAVPVAANIGAPYLGKEVIVGYGDYNTLKLSRFSYKLTSRTSNTSTYIYNINFGFIYNEFNSAVISQLKANDTLAVQESFLTLKSR